MRSEYFTKDDTISIKGAMIIMVIIHHIYLMTLFGCEYLVVDYLLRSFGYIGVAGFFFVSGYGVTISNTRSGGVF